MLGDYFDEIEDAALSKISLFLADVENAPLSTIYRIAVDDDIVISGAMLARSPALTDEQLIAIARAKPSQHLLAISERKRLSEGLTDALLGRNEGQVLESLVRGELVNQITVDEHTTQWARVALERMLEIT